MSDRKKNSNRILLCAYACNPGKGSEESVGWDTTVALAHRGHSITVLTRSKESQDCVSQIPDGLSIRFVAFDLPSVLRFVFSKVGKLGVELEYLLWSLMARKVVLKLQEKHAFDSAQHVTYARYWMPSPLASLPVPFIWGPLGGGESIPALLRGSFSQNGLRFERMRDRMRDLGERSKLVRACARRSAVALANTSETADRMRHLGAHNVQIVNSAALSSREYARLAKKAHSNNAYDFVSVGRALEWKGFQFGIRAFAALNARDSRYAIISNGPHLKSLKALAEQLDVMDQIDFFDFLPRDQVFDILGASKALVHPSMHESGGFVCLEAMAAGCPVVCLRTGGPGLFVDDSSGYPVFVGSVDETISRLTAAMTSVREDAAAHEFKRLSGQKRVARLFSMEVKADQLSEMHLELSGRSNEKTRTRDRKQIPAIGRNRRRSTARTDTPDQKSTAS